MWNTLVHYGINRGGGGGGEVLPLPVLVLYLGSKELCWGQVARSCACIATASPHPLATARAQFPTSGRELKLGLGSWWEAVTTWPRFCSCLALAWKLCLHCSWGAGRSGHSTCAAPSCLALSWTREKTPHCWGTTEGTQTGSGLFWPTVWKGGRLLGKPSQFLTTILSLDVLPCLHLLCITVVIL